MDALVARQKLQQLLSAPQDTLASRSDPIMQGDPAQMIRNYLTAQRLAPYLTTGNNQ